VADCIPISSTKSLTGHPLGASGAIEAVASVQAITSGMIPPTANLDDPDPALGLDFVALEPCPAQVQSVLSSSFAFGGHNVVLAFTRTVLTAAPDTSLTLTRARRAVSAATGGGKEHWHTSFAHPQPGLSPLPMWIARSRDN
jgi:acyl transferase domain-containing protein